MLFVPYAPGDEIVGDWRREELLKMDACFVSAVTAAFEAGRESPAAARATVRVGRSAAVVEEAAIQAAWNLLWQKDGEMSFAEIVVAVQACCPNVTAARIRAGFERRFKVRRSAPTSSV
jgi:hypothetical protein